MIVTYGETFRRVTVLKRKLNNKEDGRTEYGERRLEKDENQ